MAATFLSPVSLLQPNPSLSHTPHQSPCFSHVLRNQQQQHPINLCFAGKRANSKHPISAKKSNNPIVVIDNYDSFTYNLCQKRLLEAFGGKIVPSPSGAMHEKCSLVYYDEKGEDGLLAGLPNPFLAGRYHCLVIEKESFPAEELEVTAWTEDGLIMAARHKKYRHLQGVQFHPESILTPEGKTIVLNFVKLIKKRDAAGS